MKYNKLNQFFIYQLNTRIFCKENGLPLVRIPENFFYTPEVLAADAVWLMGVWYPSTASIQICKTHEGLAHEFRKTLPDLTEKDIIGSPYAIYKYEPNPYIAGHLLELKQFRYKLNTIGKKLILDFVPNHMAKDSPLIDQFPDLFLYKKEPNAVVCKNSFLHSNGRVYFYGRDPYFDGWTDTVQWDFSNPETLRFHIKIILEMADVCDGIRCDMAMLPLEDVFKNTHGIAAEPYWHDLIASIKEFRQGFCFIAEVYWNREYDLQQLGFDYTYDKTLYDRLRNRDGEGVRLHLEAHQEFQEHSLRFIENHDEERASSVFGEYSNSNFALLCFLPGSILYHHGQSQGRKIKVPVQLGRLPEEPKDYSTENFYERALAAIQRRQNKKIELDILELKPYGEDYSLTNCIVRVISNTEEKQVEILVFNSYSYEIMGALHLPDGIIEILKNQSSNELILNDLVSGESYSREKDVLLRGMFIRLQPGRAHWFVVDYT